MSMQRKLKQNCTRCTVGLKTMMATTCETATGQAIIVPCTKAAQTLSYRTLHGSLRTKWCRELIIGLTWGASLEAGKRLYSTICRSI